MGANNSTRRVSFESDENENITVVKGIRLSENVINRMREPAAPLKTQNAPTPPPSTAPTLAPSPLLRSVPLLFNPVTTLPPPLVEPVAPPAPSATETVAAPSPPPPQPPKEQPPLKPVSPAPVSEPVAVPESSPVPPRHAAPAVDEEALKKTTDELYKGLEQERAKADQELQAWLETEKARASGQAHAKAQSQVQDEVSSILSVERAIIREKIASKDERRHAQLYEIGRKDLPPAQLSCVMCEHGVDPSCRHRPEGVGAKERGLMNKNTGKAGW
uniref:coiled-coil-helix-coiled-coil-helix domain containing 3a isoform X3 n=1 Tax=Monopterus albus TaxID=43700 RepID=UPI0009B4D134|nr:MICOS complex subunit MIC19 isoform X3 [Monopterus albus]